MHARNLLAALVMSLALVAPLCGTAFAEESADTGVNRPGRDYKDFDMEPSIAGYAPCQAACASDHWCRAWAYANSGIVGPKPHCWLKKSVPDPVNDSRFVSGVSGVITGLEFDTNRFGSDYRDFAIGFNYVELSDQVELRCKTACEKDDQCKAWTYVKPEKEGASAHCWLKNAVPDKSRNNCCISGVVARMDPQEAADRNPQGKTIQQCQEAWGRNQQRCLYQGALQQPVCLVQYQQILSVCVQLAANAAGSAGGGTTTGGGGGGAPAEWDEMLRAHNAKRALHGSPPLVWDANLAAGAQDWANGCRKDASGNYAHSHVQNLGENLYAWTNGTSQSAVDWWYAENKNYRWDDPLGSYHRGQQDFSKAVGHFTQVVWKSTTKLGCGVHACDGYQYFVCRYGEEPGNWNVDNPGVLDANVPPLVKQGLVAPKTSTANGAAAGGNGGKMAKVVKSVDVYDSPGGNGNQTGSLAKGARVGLAGCDGDWCHVTGDAVPNGDGFVYNGADYRSLKF